MKEFFHHLFIPQETNKFRPKLLHHQTLILLITILFSFSFLLPTFRENFPQVLGTSINIAVEDLINQTNKKREENGLKPLRFNSELSLAAKMKAKNMFAKNYWAHNAPDGTTPWFFIKKVGYSYQYAGENLARGFTQSGDVINAWMDSPSHRENMLSGNYEEIGFAIDKGKLNGEETTLVVEMFGGKTVNLAQASPQKNPPVQKQLVASIKNQPVLDSNSFTRNMSFFVTLMFIVVLILDIIIVERRRIVRLAGHNLDHIFFLLVILLFIIFISRGVIL